MYRCSDSIEQIGKDRLLDLMYTGKPVFRLVEKNSLWYVQKCKVIAITNEKLILCEINQEFEGSFTQMCKNVLVGVGIMVEIIEQECSWYLENDVAQFEAKIRNENSIGGFHHEI